MTLVPPPKQLTRAICHLVALDEARQKAPLDAEGLRHVAEAENIIAAQGGRAVMSAFLHWRRSGQVTRDPRGPLNVNLADTAPKRSFLFGGRG